MTVQVESVTSGRYGYLHRRIRRDDFARVVWPLLPTVEATRVSPQTAIPPDMIELAIKHCRRLADRYGYEPISLLARQVAEQLVRPGSPLGPGELVLYAAALLCREEEAVAAVEAREHVAEVLEAASARRAAVVLETAVSAPVRFTTQTGFDGEFVRGRQPA